MRVRYHGGLNCCVLAKTLLRLGLSLKYFLITKKITVTFNLESGILFYFPTCASGVSSSASVRCANTIKIWFLHKLSCPVTGKKLIKKEVDFEVKMVSLNLHYILFFFFFWVVVSLVFNKLSTVFIQCKHRSALCRSR